MLLNSPVNMATSSLEMFNFGDDWRFENAFHVIVTLKQQNCS